MGTKLVGIRLHDSFAKQFKNFCKAHHLIMSSFVEEVLQNKMNEILEDEEDIATYEATLNDPTVEHSEVLKILKKRGIDV